MTSQDIRNIQKSYNIHIKDGYRHKNDSISVYLRVQEWKQWEENPVVLYKEQFIVPKNFLGFSY